MKNLHDILIKRVKEIPYEECALCLSGGIDSAALLLALLECGKKVTVYSFTLDDRESSDFRGARSFSEKHKVDFVPIYLPTDIEVLKTDVRQLSSIGARRKTDFECTWAFLYVYPQVKEKAVIMGTTADGHFCLSKSGLMHYRDNLEAFRDMYFRKPNVGQLFLHKQLADKYDKKYYAPYFSKEISDYLKGSTWDELNKPQQKMPIRVAFEELKDFGKHTNLQLGDSGIAEHFTKLLDTDLNKGSYKSVVGIYNQLVRDAQV